MNDTSFQPAEILAALERHGVRYVVIDGLAATLHGSPIMTTDADICPARDRENLERLANALKELRARIRTGHSVAVASLEDVIRSKEAANRPKDQAALPTLRLLLRRLNEGT